MSSSSSSERDESSFTDPGVISDSSESVHTGSSISSVSVSPDENLLQLWMDEQDFGEIRRWLRNDEDVHHFGRDLIRNRSFLTNAPISCVKAFMNRFPKAFSVTNYDGREGNTVLSFALRTFQEKPSEEGSLAQHIRMNIPRNNRILKEILQLEPTHIRIEDQSFGYPLHMACSPGSRLSAEVFTMILDDFPEAAGTAFPRLDVPHPIQLACRSGYLQGYLFKKLLDASPDAVIYLSDDGSNEKERLLIHWAAAMDITCRRQKMNKSSYISTLMDHAPGMASVIDPVHGLPPFMLAALGKASCLNSTYLLLQLFLATNDFSAYSKALTQQDDPVKKVGKTRKKSTSGKSDRQNLKHSLRKKLKKSTGTKRRRVNEKSA